MNIALLFGSFNPVHNGHLAMAHAALQSNKCDEVWFVVSPHNPLKSLNTLASANDRAHMVSLALQNESKIKICTIEFDIPTPSYTIHTIRKLKEEYPSFNFHILCGTDVVNSLPAWYKYEELIQAVKFLVCSREIENQFAQHTLIQDHPEQFEFIAFEAIDVSSTQIREQLSQAGESSQVTEQVQDYIIAQRLYGV
ncbi:MAG: nicotinate (nicotinamide) nucleotide adenylyltransferase [Flavobacteriales bacterium]|jgi:nicotinate-nucleotide adenylyltransferase|nr:nicotinate (nicotinamide) nucleotide adenylyltransferase [Flavobacteriales bacterium]MDP4717506.1 nicotinate (nicotinamide) nucleotide adenylyltransferase [Flavobacteriales bacterium]MDP4818011.1 nicotinate (nicotinamide) nucleotide adenylyltransferase [Flavobacteriales bacterium]